MIILTLTLHFALIIILKLKLIHRFKKIFIIKIFFLLSFTFNFFDPIFWEFKFRFSGVPFLFDKNALFLLFLAYWVVCPIVDAKPLNVVLGLLRFALSHFNADLSSNVLDSISKVLNDFDKSQDFGWLPNPKFVFHLTDIELQNLSLGYYSFKEVHEDIFSWGF